jgi:lysophospholipase L1-like esterase
MAPCRWLAVAALASNLLGAVAQAEPVRVILVGDSTLATGTGYGDALCRRFKPAVACLNLARGGRSSGSFRAEGLWNGVLDRLRERGAGTVVLIQFGHNDQPGKPGRSTDLATEYPANLARYVVEAKALGAQPVLVTPLTRRSFRDGTLNNDLRPWADAARAVASAQQVPLLDLNASSAAAVQAMGQAEADTLAEAPPGAPRFDRTHLGPKGACLFAGMVAQSLPTLLPPLAEAMRADPGCP